MKRERHMSEPDLIGRAFGNYRIEARLGIGGMGQVYRARHLHLDRFAAIKVLHAHLAADEMFRSRFLQEARSVSMLEHPNIVQLIDFGEQDGQLYLVMELVTDGSLRSLLRARSDAGSGWSLPAGVGLVRQAADGLAYAHARGMIHRDIKPDNLLLQDARSGERRYITKLADFGLARLAEGGLMTASGVTLGTPAYMSPEQCQGQRVDARSDIYSLGVVLYEVVTGQPPFTLRSISDAIYNHVYVAPPPPRLLLPDLSDDLEAVILRCLAKRPDDRFQSVAAFVAALDAASASLPERPHPPILPSDQGPLSTAIETDSLLNSPRDTRSPVSDPAGATVPRILVVDPSGAVIDTANLTGDGLTVGRLSDNRLVLDVDGVSRHHLLIDWDGAHAHVTDISATSGASLGGTPIPAYVARDWDPHDTVRIGGLQLRLVVPGAASSLHRPGSDVRDHPGQPEPAASLARRRWPFLVAASVAVVVLATAGALFLSGGDDGGSGVSDATSTTGTGAVSAPTQISAVDAVTMTVEMTASPAGATPTVPTVEPTPATAAGWIAEAAADPEVGPILGQQLEDPAEDEAPSQLFERGLMISLDGVIDDGGMLVAVASADDPNAGNFVHLDTSVLASVTPVVPESGPPPGLYTPPEPFATVWMAAPDLQNQIGWATTPESNSRIVYERFEHGLIVFLADTSRTWVFYGDPAPDSSSAWRAFWNGTEPSSATALVGLQQIARVAALPEVSNQLGAPLTDAIPEEIPHQLFEHGLMLTTDFLVPVNDPSFAGYVVTLVADLGEDAGSWGAVSLVSLMLDPNTTPLGTPPAGLYGPADPFGTVLQHDAELAAAIGWASTSGLNSDAAWEDFERGLIIWFADTSRCWVLQDSVASSAEGNWRSFPDE